MALSTIIAFVGDEVFSGNILMIIALHFKATEGYIGLLWFLILSSSLAQLFMVSLVQGRSKKLLLYGIYGGAMLCSVPVLGLEWTLSHRGAAAALVLLALCVGLRQTVYNTANPVWMALLRQMTPAAVRGRWLGLLRTGWQASLVLTLIVTGVYLGRNPEWNKLQVMLIIGVLAQLFRTLCLVPVPRAPSDALSSGNRWRDIILTPIRDKTFRPFLLYLAFYGLALGLQDGFRLVYLIRLGFGQNLALVCSSLTALGAVTTLFQWGKLADRFGNHGVFSLSLAGFIACAACWIFVSSHPIGLVLAMILFFAAGIFNSGNGLVQTRYLWAASNPELQASYIAVAFVILQQATGVGALLGGQLLTLADRLGFQIGATGINNYHVIFLTSTLMFLVPWLIRRRMKEPADSPTREVIAVVLQQARTTIGSMAILGKGRDKQP